MNAHKILLLLACILFLPPLIAQSSFGKIEGVMREKETGGTMHGGSISIENNSVGGITNGKRRFRFERILKGKHTLTVSFWLYVRNGKTSPSTGTKPNASTSNSAVALPAGAGDKTQPRPLPGCSFGMKIC